MKRCKCKHCSNLSVRISLTLDPRTLELVRAMAKAQNISQSAVIRHALALLLDRLDMEDHAALD